MRIGCVSSYRNRRLMQPSQAFSVEPIDAGPFGQWLTQAQAALRGHAGMQVPCGDCVGCCTSHYSILLRPEDAALDLVPAAVLSSVTGKPYPYAKMNPRADGTCPMFVSGLCSIYAQRPQTCLDYDCRVFAAAGLEAGEDKPVINRRIRAWQFTYETEADRIAHQAIQAAAQFILQHVDAFPSNWAPRVPAGVAVLALKVHHLFIATNQATMTVADRINAVMSSSKDFDQSNTL